MKLALRNYPPPRPLHTPPPTFLPFHLASTLSTPLSGSGQGHSVFWFLNTWILLLGSCGQSPKYSSTLLVPSGSCETRHSLNGCKPQLLQNLSFQSETVQSPHSNIRITHRNLCLISRLPPPLHLIPHLTAAPRNTVLILVPLECLSILREAVYGDRWRETQRLEKIPQASPPFAIQHNLPEYIALSSLQSPQQCLVQCLEAEVLNIC